MKFEVKKSVAEVRAKSAFLVHFGDFFGVFVESCALILLLVLVLFVFYYA